MKGINEAKVGSVLETIRATCGGEGRAGFVGGDCGGDWLARRAVVWFPDSVTTAQTFDPSALTASARGSSPKIAIVWRSACVETSNTRTSFDWETLTKARCGDPAKTTSAGSSLQGIVSSTTPWETDTTLTESPRWFATQISSAVRGATEHGSSPTGISPRRTGEEGLAREKTASRPSGVFAA